MRAFSLLTWLLLGLSAAAQPAAWYRAVASVHQAPASSGSGTSIAYVQNAYTNNGSTSRATAVCKFTNSVTSGDALVVFAYYNTASIGGVSISSSPANTWVTNITVTNTSPGGILSSYYCLSANSGTTTITLTFPVSESYNGAIAVEYSGVASFDASARGAGTGGAAPATLSTASATTTANGDILCCSGVPENGTLSVGSGYAARAGNTTIQYYEDQTQTTSSSSTVGTMSDNYSSDTYWLLMLVFKHK
jgi:hypothetical protein